MGVRRLQDTQKAGPGRQNWKVIQLLVGAIGSGRVSNQRPAGGGGTTINQLDDIGDVNAPTPNDGDVLTWDSGAGEWIAQAPGVASSPSASQSPSASTSPSASSSASQSPSASISASSSASQSPSASESPSASPSITPSASQSPSASISASPSASPSGGGGTVHREMAFVIHNPPSGTTTYPFFVATGTFTITKVRSIQIGTGSCTVNGRKNSSSDIIGSELTPSTTWQSSATLSVGLVAGDDVAVRLTSVTGTLTYLVVQFDITEVT